MDITDPPPEPPPTPEPTKPAERTFSQTEVDQIVTERLERERRRATPPPKAETKKSTKAEAPDDATWAFDFSDALDAAVKTRGGIDVPRKLKAMMRQAYGAERPPDPDAWVATWLDDFGLTKKSDPPPTPTAPSRKVDDPDPPKRSGTGPTMSDKGAATGAIADIDAKIASDPTNLSKHDIERATEKYGAAKANQLITDAVRSKLKGIRLVADPRRKG